MKKVFQNKFTKALSIMGLGAILMLVGIDAAQAQDLAGVTSRLKTQIPGIADILSIVAYIAGIGFGIRGALKLKEYNESKGQQVPLSQPIVAFVVAGILLALPTMLSNSTSTIFGSGSQKTTLDGSGLRTIN